MNWIDKEVAFYDFIWAYGVGAHTNCINQELYEDFAAGGDKFKQMKKLILQKFSTREIALKEFEKETGTPTEPQHSRKPDKVKWICLRCGHRNAANNEVCMGAEMGDGQCGKPKPGKVKPLAQYLSEYIDYEQINNEKNCGFIPGINVDFQGQSISVCTWELKALLEQALDAYESTEQVKIRIERV